MKSNKSIKKKLIKLLRTGKFDIFNRYRKHTKYKAVDLRFANFYNTSLENAELRDTDLRFANLSYADLSYADLEYATLKNANLKNATLKYVSLVNVNLENANLKNANIDFSCLEFSCNTLKIKFDQRHIIQILAHACIPTMHNDLKLNSKLEKLLNSKMMLDVLADAHRKELREFKGTYKKLKEDK